MLVVISVCWPRPSHDDSGDDVSLDGEGGREGGRDGEGRIGT